MTSTVLIPVVVIVIDPTRDFRVDDEKINAVMKNLVGIIASTTPQAMESEETSPVAWITPDGGLAIHGSSEFIETVGDICTLLNWCCQKSTISAAAIGHLPSDALASLQSVARTAADHGLICRINTAGIAFEPASMRDMHVVDRNLASIAETRELVSGRVMFYEPTCRLIYLVVWGRGPEIVWLTLPAAYHARDVELSGQYIAAELIRRSIPGSDPVYTIDRFAILGSHSQRSPKNLVGDFSRTIRDFFPGSAKKSPLFPHRNDKSKQRTIGS